METLRQPLDVVQALVDEVRHVVTECKRDPTYHLKGDEIARIEGLIQQYFQAADGAPTG